MTIKGNNIYKTHINSVLGKMPNINGWRKDFITEALILFLIKADKRIINDPAEPFIAVSELADSSVNLVVRVWAEAANYWGIYFDLTEQVYKTFDKEGLNIPFPQMDVHVQK